MNSFQCILFLCRIVSLALGIILVLDIAALAQSNIGIKDSLPPAHTRSISAQKDTIVSLADSTFKSLRKILAGKHLPTNNNLRNPGKDTTTLPKTLHISISADSAQHLADSAKGIGNMLLNAQKQAIIKKITFTSPLGKDSAKKNATIPSMNKDSLLKKINPFSYKHFVVSQKKAPFIDFRGGYVSYSLNYRSNPDTPFTEKNLLQQQ